MRSNRKTLAGAGLAAIALFVLVPGSFGRVFPLLLFAACPLSMLVMMRSMSRARGTERSADGHDAGNNAVTEIVRLRAEVDQLRAAQAEAAAEGRRLSRPDAVE